MALGDRSSCAQGVGAPDDRTNRPADEAVARLKGSGSGRRCLHHEAAQTSRGAGPSLAAPARRWRSTCAGTTKTRVEAGRRAPTPVPSAPISPLKQTKDLGGPQLPARRVEHPLKICERHGVGDRTLSCLCRRSARQGHPRVHLLHHAQHAAITPRGGPDKHPSDPGADQFPTRRPAAQRMTAAGPHHQARSVMQGSRPTSPRRVGWVCHRAPWPDTRRRPWRPRASPAMPDGCSRTV